MSAHRLTLLLMLGVAAGCRDTRDLYSLGIALNREFAEDKVGVSLTDGILLTVRMEDASMAQAPCEHQVATAMRVARFVQQNYLGFDSLQFVAVAFAAHRSGDTLLSRNDPLPIRFARESVSAGLGAADSTRAAEACVSWQALRRP